MDGSMAKNSGRILALAMAGVVAFVSLPLLMADPPIPAGQDESAAETPQKTAVIITCHGMIDQGLADSIERRGNEAVEIVYDRKTQDTVIKGSLKGIQSSSMSLCI